MEDPMFITLEYYRSVYTMFMCLYLNKILYLVRKYIRISVRGFTCSKMRTVFRERSSRKTVSFEEQKRGYCIYYPSKNFETRVKNVYEQLKVCSMGCFLLSVLWCDLMNKKRFPFCGNHKTLSRFELNLKRRLIVVNIRFKMFGIIAWVIFWDIAHFQHGDIWSRAVFRPSRAS